MLKHIEEIPSAELRNRIKELAEPKADTAYTVIRRGKVRALFWPLPPMVAMPVQRRRMLQAIKYRNAMPGVTTIAEAPERPRMFGLSNIRRSSVTFFQQISLSPIPVFITYYDVPIAICVAVENQEQVEAFMQAVNEEEQRFV